MDWLVSLFTEPSYLQAVIILCLICAIGLPLGQIKIKGVNLGVTFVFFAGIFLGDICNRLGIEVDRSMFLLAQNFGLIVFVYALGVQVGPSFFTSLKSEGVKLNLLSILAMVLTTLFAIGAYALTSISFEDSMGLLCGAATNTPMLGAAQQALLDVHPEMVDEANGMATACAVGYPLGVIGVLACMIILKFVMKGKISNTTDPTSETYVAEFRISNPAVFDKSVREVASLTEKHLIISRIWANGKVAIPESSTILHEGDHILAVLKKSDLQTFNILFGQQESTDWNRPDIDWDNIDGSDLVSKHLLVTRQGLNGMKIGSLHLRNQFAINITRVSRAGIELVAHPGLRLQLGDRVTVVGEETAINKVSEILGNEQKVLRNPNLVALFIGIFLGVVLGSIPFFVPGMSVPIKLGIAGGPIVVGILMGAFGPRFKLATYTTPSANMMLRQLGITIYLACLGFGAGSSFFSNVFCMQGLFWVLASLVIAIVPIIITGLIASKFCGLTYAQNAGMLCAAMANPIALAYANTNSNEDEANEAYATVYPISMFLRVISAQLLMLLFI
ncbi:MAG: putative transporter [Bacteroidales bacterium]|nr:putative transporter [Bacteroidales bacterium]